MGTVLSGAEALKGTSPAKNLRTSESTHTVRLTGVKGMPALDQNYLRNSLAVAHTASAEKLMVLEKTSYKYIAQLRYAHT